MQTLVQRRTVFLRLAQLLLLLYGLTLGVAIVSPVVNPKILNLVCTSSGYKFVAQKTDIDGLGIDGSSDASMQGHLLDCSLCLPSGILLATYDGITSHTSHRYVYLLPPISSTGFYSYITTVFFARGPPSNVAG
jgi:hypothetical protein